jgi:hypothetical protein
MYSILIFLGLNNLVVSSESGDYGDDGGGKGKGSGKKGDNVSIQESFRL